MDNRFRLRLPADKQSNEAHRAAMAAARDNDRGRGIMKKTIFAFLTLAAFSAFSQSGIVNPVSLRDLRRAGALTAANGTATNLTIDGGILSPHTADEGAMPFGINYNTNGSVFFGLHDGEDWPGDPMASGKSTFCIGTQAGDGSTGENCFFVGYQAGMYSVGVSTLCIGEQAGVYSDSARSIYIGAGSGAYSPPEETDEIQIGNVRFAASDDGALYSAGRVTDDTPNIETKIGYIAGNLVPRGTNVVSAYIITNAVQQKDGSGYVTNIILQGINGKVIQ